MPALTQAYIAGYGFYSVVNGAWSLDNYSVRTWTDLRFPAQGINPAGAVAAPTVDTVETDFPGTLLFSGAADNMVAGVAQMPHEWVSESDIYPHIHWSLPIGSAAAVTWQFYYRLMGVAGDNAGAWVGPVAAASQFGTPTTANNMLVTTFAAIPMTGMLTSAMLAWRLYRRGLTDPNNNTARLAELVFHYLSDKPGSIAEYHN